MQSKYGKIDDSFVKDYIERLVGKVFKLLPMKQEKSETLHKYHESLMYELFGFRELFDEFSAKAEFISLVSSLESLMKIEDFNAFRGKVFECITMIKSLR